MVEPLSQVPELVLRGRVVTSDAVLQDGLVAISGQRIVWVGRMAEAPDADWPAQRIDGTTLLPGLIDLHCHGGGGRSFPDGDVESSRAAAHHHLVHGTTGVVASLVAADEPEMINALTASAELVALGVLAGIHLEGPFLSPSRCGAQNPSHLRLPDLAFLDRLLAAGGGHVVSMTYAAELPGARGLVEAMAAQGVIASLGHTDADMSTASAALSLAADRARTGRASVTHLFNAMRPFHHRDPGPVAASLRAAVGGTAVLELVADGVHLDDATVATVLELVGPGSVALVTDAMAAAGMPDGRYRLGPSAVSVEQAVARLVSNGDSDKEPGALAGGTTRLIDVVRRCVQEAGVGLTAAVEAASSTPARLLGINHDRGALAVGLRADVLAVDDDLVPVAVWTAGRRVDPEPATSAGGPSASGS